MAAWSELHDRALLAAVLSCDYRWRDVARWSGEGYGARTAQACEHRFRLLIERERAHRREHLARLVAEPVVRARRTDALFAEAAKRADAASFPQMRRKESRSGDPRVVVARRTLTRTQLLERAEHADWKRTLMAKAAAERAAERKADKTRMSPPRGRMKAEPLRGGNR